MKTWLKGGLILGCIAFLLSFFIWAIPRNSLILNIEKSIQIFFVLPLILTVIIGLGNWDIMNGKLDIIAGLTLSIMSFVTYFILGALIGWIIGRFKK